MLEFPSNFLAIFLSSLAAMFIGFLWYSPVLFGNTWMKLSGVTKADIDKAKAQMPKVYGLMFLASLVMAYVLSHFIFATGSATPGDGVMVGFWAWLGFVATTMLTGVLYENKPMNLYYINAGYQLVTLLTMGAILSLI